MAKNKNNLYVKYKMISYKAKGKRKKLPQKMACDRTASQTVSKKFASPAFGKWLFHLIQNFSSFKNKNMTVNQNL